MQNIFLGFLFLFLNFRLTFDNIIINCIPNFIGYIFLLKGLEELGHYSLYFEKSKAISKVLLVYEIFTFVTDLFGFSGTFTNVAPLMVILVGIVYTAVSLYCSFCIVRGLMEMGNQLNSTTEPDRLYIIWKYIAITQVIAYITVFFIPFLSFVCLILLFIINIMFLVSLNKIKNNFSLLIE